MSVQDQEQGVAGASSINRPNPALSAKQVAEIVKAGVSEGLGSFQVNFDRAINAQKKESEKALSQVESLKKSAGLQFRFKGNKAQFEFNESVLKLVGEAQENIVEGSLAAASESLNSAFNELTKRNKLVRIADKSEGVVLVISLLFVATTIQAIDRQLDLVMLEQEDMPAQVRSPLTCVLGAEEWGTGGESVEGTNKRPVSKMAAHMAFPSTSSGKGADGQGAFTDSEVVSGQEETGDDQYRRVLGEVLKASRATSTANKYSKAFSAWQEWCLVHRVSHMPASQDDISRYFIYLYVDQAPFSKIEAAFYSLKWHHDCNPEVNNNPCDSKFLRCLLEGLKRLKAKPVSKKDPVTPDILNKIVLRFGMGSNLMHIRLCAICLTSYAGFYGTMN
ncbi:uncharacterized protein [Amphiura filiformis]|uniref:uncharacterized protein n=1 Tax=Amphiura filiformis TaxID=82378 RepID=UPI003B21BB5A